MPVGSRESFLTTFAPDKQRQITQDTDKCFFGGYPTLAELRRDYGNNMPVMWLIPQLYNLSEYCGCKGKLQGTPLEECAHVIAQQFYFLKVSELMLFFFRFKSGKYGRFYGSVDPLIITESLREFITERNNAIDRHDQEEREAKEREDKKSAISWEEYCHINKINNPNPLTSI